MYKFLFLQVIASIALIQYRGKAEEVLVEYCSSGEDVSVNTVIILRN
jgi:hypothetical protein